jgi:DNA repair photolyase
MLFKLILNLISKVEEDPRSQMTHIGCQVRCQYFFLNRMKYRLPKNPDMVESITISALKGFDFLEGLCA